MGLVRTLAVIAILGGCEPLADETFRGRALFSFDVEVSKVTGISGGNDAPYRVSLFWSPTGTSDARSPDLREQSSVGVSLAFPTIEIEVFAPPKTEHLLTDGRPYGVGLILAYQDRDGDGRMSPNELVGGTPDKVLIWSKSDLTSGQSPTGFRFEAGYQVARLPLYCESFRDLDDRGTRDCGVPLGAACASDADCGTGRCLHMVEGEPLPGGACAQSNDTACTPHEGSGLEQDGQFWWLGYCATDADCRQSEGYACDTTVRTCLPFVQASPLVLASDFAMPPLCDTDPYWRSSRFEPWPE